MQRNSSNPSNIVDQLRQSMQPSADNGTKKATRTIAFGSDGKPYVQFVDVSTGQPVSDLTGYQILESGNDMDWLNERAITSSGTGSSPDLDLPDTDEFSTADQVVGDPTEQAFQLRNGGERSGATEGLKSGPRMASDNFGYVNTPKALEYANMVPGIVGTGAKMVNTAINANNVSAVNAAREYIGLPSLSKGQYAGGLIGTNQYDDGLVADVKIGDNVYGVGFEALTPDGRTTLTPEEARMRSALASSPVKLATEDESKANKKQFDIDTKNDPKGVMGTIKGVVAGLGSTFGWSKDETKQVEESSLKEVQTGPYKGEAMPKGQVGNVPQMDVSNRSTTASKGATRGGGLASVSKSFNAADSRPAGPSGVNWGSIDPRQLDPGIRDVLDKASTQLGFGLNVVSGYRSPERNASVGGTKGSLHQRGMAVDISLAGLDEGQRQALVGTLSGIAESSPVRVGAYTGNTGLHVDTASMPSYDQRYGPAYPMFDKTIAKVDQAPSWFKEGLTPLPDTSRIPTPTFVGDDLEATSISSRPTSAQQAINATIDNTAARDAMTATGLGAKLGPQSYNSPRQYADMSPQAFLGTEDLDSVPAGMRNNNPGNLKYTGSPWQESNLSGLVGPSTNLDQGDPQARFNSPQAGMDSMARLAVGKYDEGMTTARSIIADVNGWTGGNVRAAEHVAATLGVGLDDDLGLREPDKLKGFMQALTLQEHGPASKRYSEDLYDQAVRATLFSPQIEAAATVPQKPTLDDDVSPGTPGKLALGTIERSALAPLNDTKESRQTAIDSRVAGAFETTASDRTRSLSMIGPSDNGTQSSGFAGRAGSPRSIEGSSFSSSDSQMAEKGDRVTSSGSGFAGRAGSARSANENNPSFDRSEGSQASASKSSGGFAGSAGSARSQSQNNGSYDGGSGEGSQTSPSKTSSGFAGSAGSARSANQNNADYDGASKSASSTSKGSSGFAGSAGSARSNNQNNSDYDGSQSDSKSSTYSAGNNSGGAKGSNGTNAGSSNKGGLGGWGGY